jgi:formylglycine-generating enzyme required for sulfatase activity
VKFYSAGVRCIQEGKPLGKDKQTSKNWRAEESHHSFIKLVFLQLKSSFNQIPFLLCKIMLTSKSTIFLLMFLGCFMNLCKSIDKSRFTDPSTLSPEHQEYLNVEYEKFMNQRQKDKKAKADEELRKQQENMTPPPKGISPMELGLKRDTSLSVDLTEQVKLTGGKYFFGTQMGIGNKLLPVTKGGLKDGAEPRKLVNVKPFLIDIDCVTNKQFKAFVDATDYKTEAELYTWSFVLDSQVSDVIKAEVDGEKGFGRVKDAPHWMAVAQASWDHPYGLDSDVTTLLQLPVVHVSFKDASEYCAWAGLRLPDEREWEFAARGGRVNQSYPWGNDFRAENMNIWGGDSFPIENDLLDGHHGPAPVGAASSYPSNDFGLYNVLGNVWEWVRGGKPAARILRGGSFVDSRDGKFNHAVRVSTRQLNAGDSAATNIGFRCAGTVATGNPGKSSGETSKSGDKKRKSTESVEQVEHIEL